MAKEVKYNKEQILRSKQFSLIERDILEAILDSDKSYSIKEASKLIKSFKESKVK